MKTKNNMTYKKVLLKSCNPSEYPDLEITCRVLENGEIAGYVSEIPEEKKCIGTKVGRVAARIGKEGEIVKPVLTTNIEGKEYVLSEEEGTVKVRDGHPDIVVTNLDSNSHESYIVKAAKFESTYTPNGDGTFTPVADPRVLTEVPEHVIITTAWGSEAISLRGSYIVTYNAEENDFNVLERGAKESTYATSPYEKNPILIKQ